MQQEWMARHAGSFGPVAADYDAARPSYPPEAVAWLAGEPPLDVLDLGAGTGRLTELLVAAGQRVTAVDPSAEMLEQLRRRLPTVAVARGSAEQVPLPDASFDVVTAAQAWHWFDQLAAPAECARLLRPGGRLGLVWNERDETSGWVGAAWRPVNKGGSVGMSLLPEGWDEAIVRNAPYGPVERADFRHEQRLSRDDVLRLVASRSTLSVMDPAQREAVLCEVGDVLDTHPETRGRELLTIVYETHCYRWTRR